MQYFGAREHLYRAYYDLFSLICVISIKDITQYSEDFSKKLLYTVYPDYFNKILPELLIVKQKIANIQTVDEVSTFIDADLTLIEKISKNEGTIIALMNWINQLTVRTGLFVEYQEKERLEEEKELERKAEQKKENEIESQRQEKTDTKADSRFRLNLYVTVALAIGCIILGALLNHYWPTSHIPDSKPNINNSKQITSKSGK